MSQMLLIDLLQLGVVLGPAGLQDIICFNASLKELDASVVLAVLKLSVFCAVWPGWPKQRRLCTLHLAEAVTL